MKITQQSIEKLGFVFKCKDDEEGIDYTFSKASDSKKGWIDLLVWHPDINSVTMSQHSAELFRIYDTGKLKRGDKIENHIIQLFSQNFLNMSQLVEKLQEHNII